MAVKITLGAENIHNVPVQRPRMLPGPITLGDLSVTDNGFGLWNVTFPVKGSTYTQETLGEIQVLKVQFFGPKTKKGKVRRGDKWFEEFL